MLPVFWKAKSSWNTCLFSFSIWPNFLPTWLADSTKRKSHFLSSHLWLYFVSSLKAVLWWKTLEDFSLGTFHHQGKLPVSLFQGRCCIRFLAESQVLVKYEVDICFARCSIWGGTDPSGHGTCSTECFNWLSDIPCPDTSLATGLC